MESESHRIGLERYTGWRDTQAPHIAEETSSIITPTKPLQIFLNNLLSFTVFHVLWVQFHQNHPQLTFCILKLYLIYFNHIFLIHPTPPHSKKSSEKDGDLKIQVEKLWREVNALKEMQALQTGETRLISIRQEKKL